VYLEETICTDIDMLRPTEKLNNTHVFVKGSLTRDFQLLFLTNQFPNGPEYPIEVILNVYISNIFANFRKGLSLLSTTPAINEKFVETEVFSFFVFHNKHAHQHCTQMICTTVDE
jgi:hypothetical protein